MATSRVTGTNENVSTYGTAGNGRDYTSVSTWEAATDNDLVSATQSEVLECYDDAAKVTTTSLNLAGATTNSSYFRIVRAASGEEHDGTPNNGVYLDIYGGGDLWRIEEAYGSFQDLILEGEINSSAGRSMFDIKAGNGRYIGLICIDLVNIDGGVLANFEDQNGDNYYINCIVIRSEGDAYDHDTGTSYYYNCNTIASNKGFDHDGGTMTLKNCLSDNNTGSDFEGSPTSTYCASSDGTASGTGSRTSQTFTYNASGSDDYHLASNDAGAKGYGTNLSGDGSFPFDDDIDGETRSAWDIGFDEYSAIGTTTTSTTTTSTTTSTASTVSTTTSSSSTSSTASTTTSSSSSSSTTSTASTVTSTTSSTTTTTAPQGSVVYGRATAFDEDYAETFALHWTDGTATVSGSGDSEIITFGSGQNKECKPWKTGTGTFKIHIDKYDTGSGTPSSIQWKTGATPALCEADDWNTYSDGVGLVSEGWNKIKINA